MNSPIQGDPRHASPLRTDAARSAPPPEDRAAEPLGLLALWHVLWKGKWLIGGLALAFAVLAIALTSLLEPRYTAQARIILQEGLADLDGGRRNASEIAAAALGALETRRLAETLAEREGLFDDPEFNPVLAAEGAEPGVAARAAGAVAGAVGAALRAVRPGEAEEEDPLPEDLPPEELVRQITVRIVEGSVYLLPVPDSGLLQAVATTSDPEKSARLANALARLFLEDRLSARLAASDAAIARMGARVEDLQRDVAAADEALQDFLADNEIVSRGGLATLAAEAEGVSERLETAREAGIADRRTEALAASLAEIERRLERQTALSVQVQQLEREAEAAGAIYNRALRRLNELSVERELRDTGARLVAAATVPLQPDGTGRRRIVAVLGVLGLMTGTMIVLVREATDRTVRGPGDLARAARGLPVVRLPRAPGATLGRRGRWLRSLLSGKPTPFSEAVRRLRLVLLAPDGDGWGGWGGGGTDGRPMAVGVFSALPGEGKTTQAVAIARSFALIDRRVVLVEADMRMQRLGPLLGLYDRKDGGKGNGESAGLRGLLLGRTTLGEAVRRQEALGIDVLPAGRSEHNPADLVENGRFAGVMDTLRARYDVVVVDTPPALVVPETRVMARHVDRRVVVADWGRTRRDDLAGVLAELGIAGDEDGTARDGAVVAMNRVPAEAGARAARAHAGLWHRIGLSPPAGAPGGVPRAGRGCARGSALDIDARLERRGDGIATRSRDHA